MVLFVKLCSKKITHKLRNVLGRYEQLDPSPKTAGLSGPTGQARRTFRASEANHPF